MKHLASIILVALFALTTGNSSARSNQHGCSEISFETLVEMISTLAHWDENNLIELGLTQLVSAVDEDEECGEFYYFVYGKNTEVEKGDNWNVKLKANGCHAIAIEVTLMTDNETKLYFKDKADHDAFLDALRKSDSFVQDGNYRAIGTSCIEYDEFTDGWYIISFHAG